MKKLSRAISALLAIMVISVSLSLSQSTLIYGADDAVKAEVSATTNYYATYIASQTAFDTRGIEDVLLYLKGNGNSAVTADFVDYMKALVTSGKFGTKDLPSSYGGTYPADFDVAEVYAMMLLIAEELDLSTSDFNGCNLLQQFADKMDAFDTTSTTNPYYYIYLATAINHFKAQLPNSDVYMNKIKTNVLTLYYKETTYGTGIDIWGYGVDVDSTAAVLISLECLYDTDADVKSAVDKSIAWVLTNASADKTYGYNDYATGAYVASSDTTGLALLLLSVYNSPKAADAYEGLLTLKDSSVAGGFVSAYDPHYATRDAYYGLLAYNGLSNNKFYLDKVAVKQPETEETTTEETTTEETTTAPDTSDSNTAMIFVLMALVATAGLVAASKKAV